MATRCMREEQVFSVPFLGYVIYRCAIHPSRSSLLCALSQMLLVNLEVEGN
jgi:hypothetical protein